MSRRVVTGLLVLWCILGAAATAGGLTGPSAQWNRDTDFHGVVGIPLRGAAETAAIRSLLPEGDTRDRWLVLFPSGSDQLVLTYVRYQLAHTEYPRRVDIVAAETVTASVDYTGVITAPGMALPLPWRVVARHGGFTRHAAAGT